MNDITPQSDQGDMGELPLARQRWYQRQHLRVLEAAVYQGWQVPEAAFATIPIDLLNIVQDDTASHRDRIRAMEALAHLAQQRMDAVVSYDRIKRLDAGMATDRHEVLNSLTDQQIAAVAKSIDTQCQSKPAKRPAAKRKR
jgi:hypothetical protein